MTQTDFELINIESMEFARMCTPWDDEECKNEATWLLTIKCCDAEIPLCDAHKIDRERWWEEEIDDVRCRGFYCDNCGHRYFKHLGDDPRNAVRFERI